MSFCLAGVAGFEPTNARIKIVCLTAWRYPNIFQPFSFSGWGGRIRTYAMLESESNALPLGDTPMIKDFIWGDLRGSNP